MISCDKGKTCLDPVMKYCQECPYGNVHYADDVETYQDTFGTNFETHCIYGLEKQQPSEEELKQFDDWCKKGETTKHE